MIIDSVQNMKKYAAIPHLDEIMVFMEHTNMVELSEGDHPIKGEALYVKVLNYIPKPTEENNFETHDFYTDVQVLIEGIELMQTAPSDCLNEKADFQMDGDFNFFSADKYISDIVVRKGQFVVFFPQEAHRPGCRYQDLDTPVIKWVFKTSQNTGSLIP